MDARYIKVFFKVGMLLSVTLTIFAMSLQRASTSGQLLFDHFEGSMLDTSRWTILDGGSGMFVSSSLFQSTGGPDHKRINSIATFAQSGQSVRVRARIRLAGDYQKFGFNVNAVEFPGLTMGYYFDTYDNQFGNNEHTTRVIVSSVSASGSYAELMNAQVSVTWYEFHEFSVVRTGAEVIFSIDNQEVARIADAFTDALPVGVWNDRPPLMQTDWIEVSQFESGCVTPPANLVGWWPGDGNANDIAGANNGALVNGATFAPGMVDQAFSFDGTDDAVEISDAPNLNPTQQITVDSWVYPTATSGDPDVVNMIVNKEEFFPSGTVAQYELGRKNTGDCSPDAGIPTGNLAFFLGGISGLPTQCRGWIDGGAFLPLNAWSHVALTFDGAAVRTYVNGILSRQLPASGTLATTNGKLRIGARNQSTGEQVQSSRWAGMIDEVQIFNRALSAAEIQDIFNAGSAGKCKNAPPVAMCQDVTVSAGAGCTANASIDNGSFDPDGDAITLNQSPPGPYPLGSTSVTLTVSDSHGVSSQCTANVTVVDDTPPAITNASASPSSLWPPNHKLVNVTVNYSVSDNCGASPGCVLSVASNEPVNGTGDGDTSPDWEVIDAHHVRLRAERAGVGTGRVYTITITCTDGAGNSATTTVTVSVPHDRS